MADSGIDHHIRPCNRAKAVHFAEMIYSKLQYRNLMFTLYVGNRKRKSDQIVFVSFGFMHSEMLSEDRRHHLFSGRLPHRTGYADNRNFQYASESGHQFFNSRLYVFTDDNRPAHALRNILCKCARRTFLKRSGNIVMAVCILPAVGGKQAAGRYPAAVNFDPRQLAVAIRHRINLTAADCGGPCNSQVKHRCLFYDIIGIERITAFRAELGRICRVCRHPPAFVTAVLQRSGRFFCTALCAEFSLILCPAACADPVICSAL